MQSEASPLYKYVYSSEMVNFVTASNGFCQFLEQSPDWEGKLFITTLVQHLSDVYACIVKLGETEPVYESALEPTVTEQDWAAIYQQIVKVLGPFNDYLRPAEEEEFDRSELVKHTISEDMADIYQELKDFTVIYSRGLEEYMNDASWELKERFAEHWGKKLLRSLIALHDLYIKGVDPTEEE
jgi:hypothetical protein